MNKTALITGASGGLGKEFARIHASKGGNLVLVARSADKLEALKFELEKQYGVSAYVIGKDLSDQYAPKAVYDELKAKQIQVDYLINNAGFGDFGLFAETEWEKQLDMINVNVTCLTYMTRLFLPDMIKNKAGKILNIASTAAFQPGPTMSVYFATKAYVLSFSEAIANELKGTGVTVTALCPGATETGFKAAAALDNSNLFKGNQIATSKEVAEFGYPKMMEGKTVVIHGAMNNLMAQSVRFAPRNMVTAIARMKLKEK
ncbi:MAG: SDR family oxidoreductase [Bacteroidota bacterium]|nr:SDR family oxidoreductase [Bacteroidota bacterium]